MISIIIVIIIIAILGVIGIIVIVINVIIIIIIIIDFASVPVFIGRVWFLRTGGLDSQDLVQFDSNLCLLADFGRNWSRGSRQTAEDLKGFDLC